MAKQESYSPDPERIQLYLSGNMKREDQIAFEQEMDEEEALREAVRESALASWTIQAYGQKEEMAKLNELYEANTKSARILEMNYRRWLAVAAITALLLLSYFFLRPTQSLNYQEVLVSYYEAPASPDVMSVDALEMLRKADMAYATGKWREALQTYAEIPEDSLSAFQDSRVALFSGICQMELDNWDAALAELQKADQHLEQRDWQEAFVYLRKGDREKGIELLERIANLNEHYYAEKAKDFLKDLEKVKD
ncbi:MAG: hypothetical protein AAF696_35095 [Bacteroidota bacterium]